jgi:CubicO group peptidase (beta-lactamase class C family)
VSKPSGSTFRVLHVALFLLLGSGSWFILGAQQVVWPDAAWPTSTPEAEGLNAAAIDSLVADIEAGRYGLLDHFLLIRHGKVVADHHYTHDYDSIGAQYDRAAHQYNYDHPNWHPYFEGTELHTLQSVTKSVNSAGLGIAIDEGLIAGVQVPVLPFFSEYDFDDTDPRKQAITLADLLTMRSGLHWVTEGGYSDSEHSTVEMELSDTWIQYILDRTMDAQPGTVYEYNDGASVLIGKIIREATGVRADRWVEERLFDPIGIERYHWKITPDGEADTEGGLYLEPHDLARIGYLFMRGGEWDGRQIVSRAWVDASTAPVVPDVVRNSDRPDVGYGYQWWVPLHEEGKTRIFGMNGYGGQFLLASPEHDLLVVFNGWNIHAPSELSSLRAFQDRIIPAIQH